MPSIGRLWVELIADTEAFRRSMNEAADTVAAHGARMSEVGGTLSRNVTAPILAMGAAAVAAAVNVGEQADKLLDLADMTGLTTTRLQEFRAIEVASGTETDTLADAVVKLQTRMASGEEGAVALRDGVAALGISLLDANGNMRSMDEIVGEVIPALAAMEDGTQRNLVATDIFGRSAAELAPILSMGSAAMQAATDRARDMGMVMSNEALVAADAFRAEVDVLKASFGQVAMEIGIAVIPIVRELVDIAQDHVIPAVRSMIDWWENLSPPMQQAVTVVGAVVAAVGPMLVVLGHLVSAVGSIIRILPILRTAMMAVWAAGGPITIAIAAAAALVAAGVLIYRNWDEIKAAVQVFARVVLDYIGRVRDFAVSYFQNMRERGQAIIDAMFGGIIGVFTNLRDRVLGVVRGMVDGVTGFFGGLADVLVGHSIIPDMVNDIVGEFEGMSTGMQTVTAGAVVDVETEFGKLGTSLPNKLQGAIDSVFTTLDKFGIDVPADIKGIVGDITSAWGEIQGALNTDLTSALGDSRTQWVEWGKEVIGALGKVWEFLKRIGGAIREAIFGVQQGYSFGMGQGQPVTGLPGFSSPNDIFSTQRAVLSGRYANTTFSSGAALQTQLLTDMLAAVEDTAISNRAIKDNTAGLSGFAGTGAGPSDMAMGEDVSRQQRMAGSAQVVR